MGKYLDYASLRYRPVNLFLQLEPVVTAFLDLDFTDFGHDRSELSLIITGTYRYYNQ